MKVVVQSSMACHRHFLTELWNCEILTRSVGVCIVFIASLQQGRVQKVQLRHHLYLLKKYLYLLISSLIAPNLHADESEKFIHAVINYNCNLVRNTYTSL